MTTNSFKKIFAAMAILFAVVFLVFPRDAIASEAVEVVILLDSREGVDAARQFLSALGVGESSVGVVTFSEEMQTIPLTRPDDEDVISYLGGAISALHTEGTGDLAAAIATAEGMLSSSANPLIIVVTDTAIPAPASGTALRVTQANFAAMAGAFNAHGAAIPEPTPTPAPTPTPTPAPTPQPTPTPTPYPTHDENIYEETPTEDEEIYEEALPDEITEEIPPDHDETPAESDEYTTQDEEIPADDYADDEAPDDDTPYDEAADDEVPDDDTAPLPPLDIFLTIVAILAGISALVSVIRLVKAVL